MKEMVGGCCVCSDERGWPDNPLVYCDGNGCTVAVHQACYGIVTVPVGPWYCRKCEITDRTLRVRCGLCPSRSGALKRSDTGGWAHVVCALYIPEVRFGNVTSMEPIILQLIPPERFNKTCYVCQEAGKLRRSLAGACMQCNKSGCKQQFHVTCAQGLGLLCEEAGNYLDNVKYCGYCQHHYAKLKKGGNVKTIPPYKPIHDSQSSDSSDDDGDSSPGPSGSSSVAQARTRSRRSSHSRASSVTASTSAAGPSTSKAPTQPLPQPGPSTGKGHSKKSPAREAGRRSSAAGEPSPAPPAPPTTPHPADAHTAKAEETSSVPPEPRAESSPAPTAPAAPRTGNSPAAPSVICDTPPSYSSAENSAAQTSVLSSTDYSEVKQTKKRKAISSSANSINADYLPPPPPVANPQPPLPEESVKKPKTDSAVIVSPASIAGQGQQSPGQRSRPPSSAAMSHIRSPSQVHGGGKAGGGSEREALPASLLVSVPLPSTTQDVSFVAPMQVVGTSNEGQASSAHSFYQMQKQVAAQGGQVPSSSRLSWGGLSVYDMQQPESHSMQKPAEKRPAPLSMPGPPPPPPPPPLPGRNKKRAAMSAPVLAHANTTTPSIQLSPGALVSSSKMPPLPPPQHSFQDSPCSSPGFERSRNISSSSLTPHMLGNELNLESSAADLSEQLSAELAAHVAGPRVPSPLAHAPPHSRHLSGSRSSSMSSSSGGTQTLEQLLERQWEQGSAYIMERAKNFDIASLLSCLHQLRTENVRLEEQVGNLSQRKETLLAVNARLANPLSAGTAPSPESGRCSRDSSRPPSVPRSESMMAVRTESSDRSAQIMMQQKPS